MKFAIIFILGLITVFAAVLVSQNLKKPTHLGVVNGELAPMPSKPNAVSSQTDQSDKKVAPLPFKESPEQTMTAIKNSLASLGNNEISQERSDYIYTVFTTPLMRYHDDVEIYMDNDARLVHFRSQSRAGYSDMGVNRKRYEAFREYYSQ